MPHAICSRLAAISFTVDEYDAAPTVCAENGAIPGFGRQKQHRSNIEASDPEFSLPKRGDNNRAEANAAGPRLCTSHLPSGRFQKHHRTRGIIETRPGHTDQRICGASSRISNPSRYVWWIVWIPPSRPLCCTATPARHHQGAAIMASTATPSPETISASEFHALLDGYSACLSGISEAKGGAQIQFGP